MGDDITIGVTEIVNNIEVTAQPNDQIVDISVTDNADNVTLNITPTVIEINVNKGGSFAKWGDIYGTLSDQTDLQNALNLKANLVGGKVPASELPSYVDDIIEVANYAALPATGEIGKIYVTLDNNKIYRWSGSVYIEIASNSAIWGAITGTLSSQTDLQNALNAKEPTITTGTTAQYWRGDKTFQTLDKTAVGLGNVDNTSDLNKPISTATQTALDLKQNTTTLTTTGTTGAATLVGSTLNIPNYTTDISGLVPYTGATTNVDLGSHKLTASDLVINHASGSGVAASITKGGSGEALTVVKSSGSGNAASITGGTTLLSELHLTTDLADDYIASAATWNAKQSALNGTGFVKISGTTISYDNTTYLSGTVAIANGGTGATTASAARTNLGATTIGSGLFTLPNAGLVSFLRVNADNTVELLGADLFRTSIGAGTGNGSVTSVNGTGSYGGLTLTGTVTGSGDLTLGGTPEGTWPISITGNAASVNTVQVSTNADFYLTFADANNGSPTSEFLYTIGSIKVNPSTGALTAGSFVKSGGTSSQYLMADGSVSTGSGGTVTGTGTTNYIPKFTGASAIGNSVIYDNGTNVGIGTTSPINGGGAARWLTIDGTTNYSGGLVASINGNAKAYFYSQEGYAIVQGSTGEGVKLMPNGTNGLSIFSNGNTFIGSSPTDAGNRLEVIGTANNWSGSFSGSTATGQSYGAIIRGGTNSSDVAFSVNNAANSTTYFRVRGDGNVGIGTTSPVSVSGYKALTINGTSGGILYTQVDGTTAGFLSGEAYFTVIGESRNVPLWFATNNAIKGGFSAAGNLLIGTTTDAGYKLDVNGAGRFNGYLDINYQASAANGSVNIDSVDPTVRFRVSGGTANKRIYEFRAIAAGGTNDRLELRTWNDAQNAASSLLSVTNGGNVGIGTTTPSTKLDVVGAITASGGFFNSDMRLKDLIDYDYNVSDIKPITYLWKDGRDNKKHVGYSAQEVQKVMPDAVNEDDKGFLSVNYVEVLVAKIEAMEKEIAYLKSKM